MPVKPLTFFGDREAPSSAHDVSARRPILGNGKRPKQLLRLCEQRSLYVQTADGAEPAVRIERVAKGERGLWRVDVPLGMQPDGARPGLVCKRERPETFRKQISTDTPFTGFRPAWADTLFVPRKAATERRVLRRLNQRRVTPLWVYGNDDRWVFRDASWPWGLVGRVFNSDGFSGTGTLVGDRIVITASHMVPWGRDNAWMLFVPAYYDGQSLHGAGVQSYATNAYGYENNDVVGYDWAVLRLEEPLGTMLGYFGYNGYSDDWNDQPYWSVIGYPGAVANAMRPSFQNSITINDTDSDSNDGEELESDTADVSPGDSGGPIFSWWGNDPRIVGVVSGEEEMTFLWWTWDQDNIMASGSGFTNLCAWGRTNWPA